MVDAGRTRAASLGFPDAYAFTKAMAEQAIEETRGDIPLTIVRPSIIESAWSEPNPGWIRGFRMAEPIIMNYGRGMLREFPGIPKESSMSSLSIWWQPRSWPLRLSRPTSDTTIYQVASGGCNPVKISTLTDYIHDFFGQHPIYDDRNQPISPARWTYPGRGRVVTQLNRAKKTLELAEKTLHRLPVRGRTALVAADLEEKRDEVEKAMGYVTLYGKYVECEALYGVDNLLELWDALGARRPRRVRVRSTGGRLVPVRLRDPPAVGPGARAGQDRSLEDPDGFAQRSASRTGAGARAPAGSIRSREHAYRLQRRFVVGLPGHQTAPRG